MDGLKGFPGAINSVYPQTHIQLCIIYGAQQPEICVVEGLQSRHQRAENGVLGSDRGRRAVGARYVHGYLGRKISANQQKWRAHWENLNTFFGYPLDIRTAIYTTNAIESLNSTIRAAIKNRKVFPTDDSVRKVIYLAIRDASKKWSMPIQNWRLAMSHFIIKFSDRLSDHL